MASCTRPTSPVMRLTRSPVRLRSWNRSDSSTSRAMRAARRSAPTRSALASARYVDRYPSRPLVATSTMATPLATAARVVGPRWASGWSQPVRR